MWEVPNKVDRGGIGELMISPTAGGCMRAGPKRKDDRARTASADHMTETHLSRHCTSKKRFPNCNAHESFR